jgi:hypothetical protein
MRRILLGVALAAASFWMLFLMPATDKPRESPQAGDTPVTVTADEPVVVSNDASGEVVADDEPDGAQPKQIALDPDAPTVAVVVPEAHVEAPGTRYVMINNKQYPLRTYQPLALPNDPLANQWWVGNAQFEPVWSAPRGSNETLLAVIDSGFAMQHEEFSGRWHENVSEMGATISENPSSLNCTDQMLPLTATCNLIDDDFDGTVDNEMGPALYENPSQRNCTDQAIALDKQCNNVDDDGNGYADDVTGWDFINNDQSPQAGELNPSGEGTIHGTNVAGVAAATGNNAKGIAGSDWGTKILPIQALDDDAYGDTLSVGRSIYYAIQQGADVINISLGTLFPDLYVREALEAATAAGIVVVASSGNDGCDCVLYPARYPEVVAVGALDTTSDYAEFSSWGAALDLLAPGTNITSATWLPGNGTSAYVSGLEGTSFSSPMVAGMITRLLSHQPTATPLQVRGGITETLNRLNLPAANAHSTRYGFGTLHAQRAVQRMTVPQTPASTYAFRPVQTGSYLDPGQPTEAVGQYSVHQCPTGTPTTAVYELWKANRHFFSISQVEVRNAIAQAHSAAFISYACIKQPHDTAGAIKQINLFKEFRDTRTKL